MIVVAALILTMAACCSKDALLGTWTGDLGQTAPLPETLTGRGGVKYGDSHAKQIETYAGKKKRRGHRPTSASLACYWEERKSEYPKGYSDWSE